MMSFLNLTPPSGTLFHFSAFIDGKAVRDLSEDFKKEAIRHHQQKGGLDLLCAAVDRFTTSRWDADMAGTVVEMTCVAISREQFELCMREAYMAGVCAGRP